MFNKQVQSRINNANHIGMANSVHTGQTNDTYLRMLCKQFFNKNKTGGTQHTYAILRSDRIY